MPAAVEFFFRPRNRFARLVARLIGVPTCGVIRAGEECFKVGDPYEIAVAFKAPDYVHAELEALGGRKVIASDLKSTVQALADHDLEATFTRRRQDGSISKQWRSTTMATTWNKAPHGPDGKLDLKLQEESVAHGIAMLKEGKEVLISTQQVALADGTHLTILHHKAS